MHHYLYEITLQGEQHAPSACYIYTNSWSMDVQCCHSSRRWSLIWAKCPWPKGWLNWDGDHLEGHMILGPLSLSKHLSFTHYWSPDTIPPAPVLTLTNSWHTESSIVVLLHDLAIAGHYFFLVRFNKRIHPQFHRWNGNDVLVFQYSNLEHLT